MLSPAQPSQPSQPFREKMHHFELLFSSKIFNEREITLFQNRTNEIIFGPKILRERIKNVRFVFVFFHHISCFSSKQHGDSSIQGAISTLDSPSFWWKFMIFDNFSMKIDYKKSTRRYVNWNFHVRYDFS